MNVYEGRSHNGKKGCIIEYIEYEPSGWGLEPSGHEHQQVRVSRFERWFHPYSGGAPIKLT